MAVIYVQGVILDNPTVQDANAMKLTLSKAIRQTGQLSTLTEQLMT